MDRLTAAFPNVWSSSQARLVQLSDGAVITNGDSMRRLYECWRKASEDHPGTCAILEYFSVPHKSVDYSIDFYEGERNFIHSLEKHFEVEIQHKNIKEAVKLYNEGECSSRNSMPRYSEHTLSR